MTKTVSLLLLAAFSIFLYQNCGSGFELDESNEWLSSQCLAEKRSIALAKSSLTQMNCSDPTNYSCEEHSFSPDLADLQGQDAKCFSHSVLGEICLTIRYYQSDTSHLLDEGVNNPALFELGGDYNRIEASCYLKESLRDGVALIAAEGSSVAEAVGSTYQLCMNFGSSHE